MRRAADPYKGRLGIPGGFVEVGETAENAVERETKEEMNLDLTEVKFLFSVSNVYHFGGNIIYPCDLFFECKAKSFDVIKINNESEEFLWVPKEKIDLNAFAFESVKIALKKWLSNAT